MFILTSSTDVRFNYNDMSLPLPGYKYSYSYALLRANIFKTFVVFISRK